MNNVGQEPFTQLDRILSPDEVLAFSGQVVWPAMNRLFGRDFRGLAIPGSNVMYEQTVVDPSHFSQTTVTFQAECERDFGSDIPNIRCFSANVRIAERRDDLTDGLLEASGANARSKEPDMVAFDLDEDWLNQLSAWAIKSFVFEETENTDVIMPPVEILAYHELLDADRDSFWDDQEVLDDEESSMEMSADEWCELMELDSGLAVAMTAADKKKIENCMRMVGLYPPSLQV